MRVSYWRLCQRLYTIFLLPYKRKLVLSIFLMLLVALCTAGHTALIKPALDKVFLEKNGIMLYWIPTLIVAVAILKAVSTYFQSYYMNYVVQRVANNIQAHLFKHLIYSDLEYLNHSSSGKLISKFTNEVNILKIALSNFLNGTVKELATVVLLLMVMFYSDSSLAFISLFVFPVAILPIIYLSRKMKTILAEVQEQISEYTNNLDETFRGIRVIKSYQMEEYEIQKTDQMVQTMFLRYIKAMKLDILSSPTVEMIGTIMISGVIFYGGIQVINGSTSPGSFFTFIGSFIAAYRPIKSIAGLNAFIQNGLAAAAKIFEVFDTKPKITDGTIPLKLSRGDIEFKDVSFGYRGNSLISGMNFKLNAGSFVVFVGGSGSGKTTIVNLIMRFFDPLSGSILIDQQDIKEHTLISVRSCINIITQDTLLFDDTILANISYSTNNLDQKKFTQAVKAAQVDEFVNALDKKYETKVGYNAVHLSGGQKQRLSIARALYRNAEILIMDEATGALDPILERKIFDAIRKIRNGKTTIVITHRMSNIDKNDMVLVYKEGNIIAQGKHVDLIKDCQEYQDLHLQDQNSE